MSSYGTDGVRPTGVDNGEPGAIERAVGSGHVVDGSPGRHAARVSSDPFADPGLPEHHPRRTDVDPKAKRRAEMQVATMFGLSTLAAIGFVAAFVAIDKHAFVSVPLFGKIGAQNLALGLGMGLSLLLIGIGVIHWSRKLMSGVEIVEDRHPMRSSDADREVAAVAVQEGVEDSRFGRRPFLIGGSLAGALGAATVAPLVTLRDLGPLPEKKLRHTAWAEQHEIVYEHSNLPILAADVPIGSMITAKPKDVEDLNELAKSAILILRLEPDMIRNSRQLEWGHEGIFAFSKICPHVGCPIGLYEQETHHLLCPCHQSTFDVLDGARVIFGPAARSLPQLRITVGESGYLIAEGDFDEPVGPSFWERG
ncbi:MAG: Rieske 2Fe-2S domain-containing protein [Sporichthyaceae bacterium]|nr:Rieske 2Fe-2S domain-containing protein [Sporichthyaceae bacterium]